MKRKGHKPCALEARLNRLVAVSLAHLHQMETPALMPSNRPLPRDRARYIRRYVPEVIAQLHQLRELALALLEPPQDLLKPGEASSNTPITCASCHYQLPLGCHGLSIRCTAQLLVQEKHLPRYCADYRPQALAHQQPALTREVQLLPPTTKHYGKNLEHAAEE